MMSAVFRGRPVFVSPFALATLALAFALVLVLALGGTATAGSFLPGLAVLGAMTIIETN